MIAVLVALIFVMQYHVMQGRRGEFLSRFLSAEVEKQVTSEGLMRALHQSQREISIVCCDLRGFTAYAQAAAPADVAAVLREYYNAVSRVVSRHGATIKDVAGDGMLILVGAPIARDDHAPLALRIAEEAMHDVTPHLTARGALGLGIGVASGPVVAGIIEAEFRLEYAAVGPAVNLASRLCTEARPGQILVASRTQELAADARLTPAPPLPLKGMGEAVPNFALAI